MKTLAIIDIGSNSIKLIIVEIKNNSYSEIFHKKFQTRLSDFVGRENKELSSEGMKNFFGIIFTFKKFCDDFNCDEIITVATESLRQIKNSTEIINNISNSLDVHIRILSPSEECYFGYVSSIPKDLKNYVHIDIGGGSVEIGLVKNKILVKSVSIPMGALIITNKFHIKDGISNEEICQIREYIYDKLKNVLWIDECKNLPTVIIGGSIKTIGRIHQKEYDIISNIHGYELSYNDIDVLLEKISTMSLDEIVSTTGISKSRGDILLGALVLINSLILYLQSPKIIISKYTIREGIINNYIKNN
ncbi:Ppx/GppA phosphatase family protein [Terrisporobacter vanillatitrophus]|uniref:Ppx/GppA phosphatase family protein n=1 Tax=Terrisporobacter vanillatitrophus TaxID=3058402 RepID=UPI003365FEDE